MQKQAMTGYTYTVYTPDFVDGNFPEIRPGTQSQRGSGGANGEVVRSMARLGSVAFELWEHTIPSTSESSCCLLRYGHGTIFIGGLIRFNPTIFSLDSLTFWCSLWQDLSFQKLWSMTNEESVLDSYLDVYPG